MSNKQHRWTRADLRVLADHEGIIRSPRVRSVAVKIYEDGSLIRADVMLELARKMTVREVVKVLELRATDLGHTIRR